ncbi:MAG: GIY-YIG nuclease family protein [Gammaproteobacteria bacterium]|nr:GIY-YIG nuclease family protein [Gammaproteobacteria bacterium]
MSSWFVYIIECGDGTLYTGITTDLVRRVGQHNAGRGARYTRGRLPVKLAYSEPVESRSEAQQREHAIKQLSAMAKRGLIVDSSGES